MSKFIDRLKVLSKAIPPPMGFKTGRDTGSSFRLMLVAVVTRPESSGIADLVAGADAAVLVDIKAGSVAGEIKKVTGLAPDVYWGACSEGMGQKEIDLVAAGGGDFLIFPETGPVLPAVPGSKLGRILEIEIPAGREIIGAVDRLPVDAVLISGQEPADTPLTWQRLMQVQHYADRLSKPLLAAVPPGVKPAELQALWEAGVDGVVVETDAGQPAGGLVKLRKAIEGLKPPSRRQRGTTAVLIPGTGRGIERETAEPGEEEEEEEE